MSEFPECGKRRGGPEHYAGEQMNGQRCHRIAGHDTYSDCLFDQAPEFEPVRESANFRTNSDLGELTRSTRITPRLVPNPRAEASWKEA